MELKFRVRLEHEGQAEYDALAEKQDILAQRVESLSTWVFDLDAAIRLVAEEVENLHQRMDLAESNQNGDAKTFGDVDRRLSDIEAGNHRVAMDIGTLAESVNRLWARFNNVNQ